MNKKRLILPICILLSLTGCDSIFKKEPVTPPVEVPVHEHTYSNVYMYDDEYHWHPSNCGHPDQIKDKEEHQYGDWKIEKDSTIFEEGVKVRSCVCGQKQTGVVEKKSSRGLLIETPMTIDETIQLLQLYDDNQISKIEYFITGEIFEIFQDTRNGYCFTFKDHGSESDAPFLFLYGVIDHDYVEKEYTVDELKGATVIINGFIRKQKAEGVSYPYAYAMTYLDNTKSPTGCSVSPRIVDVKNASDVPPVPPHTHTYSTEWSKNSEGHWHAATCEHTDLQKDYAVHAFGEWVVDYAATTSTEGLEHRTCTTCSYKEERPIEKVIPVGTGSFTLYTFNDFHGAVNEYSSSNHIGLAKFGTFLKNASKQDNVLIVDSGDTFQGSIESNYNNGAMITDVFNYAHVDVHTLGNHDFDWGESKIEANKARKYNVDGWHMTNLGANIYDYTFSTHYEGNIQQSRLGDKYYIKTMPNGLRVGVVGVIGRDQITSICSPLVEDICFKEHIQILKDLSDELRVSKGCDAVIASIHNSGADTIGQGLAEVSPVSGKKYFDYVACGHSHYNENLSENGVPYTQAAAYGECIYKAEITLNDGDVTNCDVTCLDYSTVTSAVTTIDPNITSIINTYAEEYSSVGNEIVASSTSGTFYKDNQMPNLLCKAMYEEARKEGYMVDLASSNDARYNLSGSSWTYAKLYEAFPFDNVIYIVKVRGSKNINEICKYNFRYHDASLTSVNYNTWYTVAVIDYLLWHVNSSRDYNYFNFGSDNMEIIGTLKKSNGENYLYRDICANYVRGISGTIRNSDYAKTGDEYKTPTIDE